MSDLAKKNIAPDLRFKQDNGRPFPDWKSIPLGGLATIKTGAKDTQDRQEDGKYPFFVRSNTVERINSYSFDGEAVLTSGDGVGVGKNFHYINGKFDHHQRVYRISNFSEKINGKFFFQYFSKSFYRRVIRLSAKNSVDSVRMAMISEMPIQTPCIAEQQKIAAALQSVDDKLTQLRHKQQLLQTYKRGIMQKIFTQQLRFKQDNGRPFPDLTTHEFGDIVTRSKKKFNPTESTKTPHLIELENLETNTGRVLNLQTTEDQTSIKTCFQKNDVLFGKLRPYLKKYAYPQFAGVCSSEIWVFQSDFLDSKFLYYLIQTEKFMRVANISSGSKMPRSDWDMVSSAVFKIPVIAEQQKITDFLTAIDTKIDAVAQQITQIETFKKGLLQKMFV
jgi:type I restriction enzyme S subunit